MLNFPVAAGTSGHLLGGALAAILVGPYTGVLCVSVVLLMQGVLFADGGLTALGVNITDMGVVTTVVAYARLPRPGEGAAARGAARSPSPPSSPRWSPCRPPPSPSPASTRSAAPPTSPIGKVFTAMVGVHVLIGIGEAAITALTVGAVIAVRPDLVYGARGLTAAAEAAHLAARDGRRALGRRRRAGRRARRRPAPVAAAPSPPHASWLAGLVAALRPARRRQLLRLRQPRRPGEGRRRQGHRREGRGPRRHGLPARRLRRQGHRRRPALRRPRRA